MVGSKTDKNGIFGVVHKQQHPVCKLEIRSIISSETVHTGRI